ncbi:hypothetical protein EIP91_006133 [Steccherinum ochraceum]|uniref:DUF1746 domain-containing protein n=1 Tax=Steccherinum ochraceum TaxID=92696 RepID=A0A4R0RM44_9APHY|nr:hypothetical protein EIP91_006133 [Steccherinum ochraceum]
MHKRHAQRKHIIHSLDTLLYQLHALSFFLSPLLWPYLFRVISQTHFNRPRDVDPKTSLKFWYFLILLFNAGSVWAHATTQPGEGRSVMLDFVGMAHTPTKFHLLCLDVLIIFLTMLLATISYEHSLLAELPPDTTDLLQHIPDTPTSHDISPHDNSKVAEDGESEYVLDIRLASILRRLRDPVPVVQSRTRSTDQELLPLPNVVPWQRLLRRARATAQERIRREAQDRVVDGERGGRRIPGAMDADGGS